MYFLSEKFTFDGVTSQSMNIDLVTFDSNLFNQIGASYSESVELDSGVLNIPSYTHSTLQDTEEIVLNMMLVNSDGSQKEWDDLSISNTMDWLITDTFKPFISEDNPNYIYYFKAVKIVKMFTTAKTGYLEVTFKPYSNYVYHRVVQQSNSMGEVSIINTSNIEPFYKPLIKITPNEGSDSVSITNTTVNEEHAFVFTGGNETIIVDNLLRTVQTENGENRLSKSNRKWIKLKKGENLVRVDGGSIQIECEFPIVF